MTRSVPILNYTKNLSGRNGSTIAYLDVASFPSRANSLWFAVLDSQDLRITHGCIEKKAPSSVLDLEKHLLEAYRERGFSVPVICEYTTEKIILEYVPGNTFFEDIFFDPSLTPCSYLEKLREKHTLARALDEALPSLLSESQRASLLQIEKEKIARLSACSLEAATTPLTAKVTGRYQALGFPFSTSAARYLCDLEIACAPVLAQESRWFSEANGRNWIGNTRIDFAGIFYGHADSFLLDTPYLLEDTYWLMRKKHGSSFLASFEEIEAGKEKIVADAAIACGRDPFSAIPAFHASRIYRNLLEMAYCYQDLGKSEALASQGDTLANARVFMYASMIFAHYEAQNEGVIHSLKHLQNSGSSSASLLHQGYAAYAGTMNLLVRQLIGSSTLADPALLQSSYNAFSFLRQDYRSFGHESPISIFSSQQNRNNS